MLDSATSKLDDIVNYSHEKLTRHGGLDGSLFPQLLGAVGHLGAGALRKKVATRFSSFFSGQSRNRADREDWGRPISELTPVSSLGEEIIMACHL